MNSFEWYLISDFQHKGEIGAAHLIRNNVILQPPSSLTANKISDDISQIGDNE